MAENTYKLIEGIFVNKGKNKWDLEWEIDFDKLVDLTNEEFALEIKKDFDRDKDTTNFNAQVVEVEGVNGLGDKVERIEISLGHFIYSHHYTFFPSNNNFFRTIINQEFFENIVQPFQSKLKYQIGDSYLSRKQKK